MSVPNKPVVPTAAACPNSPSFAPAAMGTSQFQRFSGPSDRDAQRNGSSTTPTVGARARAATIELRAQLAVTPHAVFETWIDRQHADDAVAERHHELRA